MLDALAESLRHDEAILKVRESFVQDIDELQQIACPQTKEQELKFALAVRHKPMQLKLECDISSSFQIQRNLDRHSNTLMLTASALYRFKNSDAGRRHSDEVQRIVEKGMKTNRSLRLLFASLVFSFSTSLIIISPPHI